MRLVPSVIIEETTALLMILITLFSANKKSLHNEKKLSIYQPPIPYQFFYWHLEL